MEETHNVLKICGHSICFDCLINEEIENGIETVNICILCKHVNKIKKNSDDNESDNEENN